MILMMEELYFYGRNYSGKSTYSKIFQSIELKQLPEKYGNIDFEVKLANKKLIKSNEIATRALPIDCKVFNQRFIDDPISSLDENNIFYIYNLIFCILEEKEFLQYFLSTHNLDFLKYTNRFLAKKDYYLIEKIKESESAPSRSFIKKLPNQLSNKVKQHFDFPGLS